MNAAPILINFHDRTINLNDIKEVTAQDNICTPAVVHLTNGEQVELIIPLIEARRRINIAEYLKENRTHQLTIGDRVSMNDMGTVYTGTIAALEDINVPVYDTELEDLPHAYPWYSIAWDDGIETIASEVFLKKL